MTSRIAGSNPPLTVHSQAPHASNAGFRCLWISKDGRLSLVHRCVGSSISPTGSSNVIDAKHLKVLPRVSEQSTRTPHCHVSSARTGPLLPLPVVQQLEQPFRLLGIEQKLP